MRKKWWMFLVGPPALALFIALGGWIVMSLWNWLLPALFGWHAITFWQALGVLLLCRILFGGFHGGRGPRMRMGERMRERWAEKMERMTPEEREEFRRRMWSRCGFGAPAGEAKEKPAGS